MFESAEMGHTIDKATYARQVPALRQALLEAQLAVLDRAKFPVLVLVNGVEGAGKGETANLLSEWMDARHIVTHGFGEHSDEERARPAMWRFWRALPPKGKLGLFFGSWYTDPIVGRVMHGRKRRAFEDDLDRIVNLEQMLTDEGVTLVKLWFHVSRDHQRARFKELRADKTTRWRVTRRDLDFSSRYDDFRGVSEAVIRRTSTGHAPWHIVEGTCPRYRALTSANLLLDAMRRGLDGRLPAKAKTVALAPAREAKGKEPVRATELDHKNLINQIDLRARLPKAKYEAKLERLQGALSELSQDRGMRDLGVMLVFEGMDAAGKGGAIRRITQCLDVRSYRVVPIAAPTDEERAQPYLWRFWRHVPRKGRITVFDRSWYGRVLVERVEGFCSEVDWRRAYGEINDFEAQVAASGVVVCKFWLQISKEEQLRRFQAREETGFKRYKITAEDWRNRKKWGAYEAAAAEMVDRTSTEAAPWTLVSAEDKHFARVRILETVVERLRGAL